MSKGLGNRETKALAEFFLIFWAVVVLAPRDHQSLRSTMTSLGFVKRRGALALTPRGKRVMRYVQGRPA